MLTVITVTQRTAKWQKYRRPTYQHHALP